MAESRAATNVHDIENMPAEWADKLEEAGYDDLDSVINASPEDLSAIDGVDEDAARQMIELAQRHEQVEETDNSEFADEDEEGEDEEEEQTEGDEEQAEEGEASAEDETAAEASVE